MFANRAKCLGIFRSQSTKVWSEVVNSTANSEMPPELIVKSLNAAAKLEFVSEACKAEAPFDIYASVLDARIRNAVVWRG